MGPRECVMLNGNPKTRAALEKAGAQVHVDHGQEISSKVAAGHMPHAAAGACGVNTHWKIGRLVDWKIT